MSDITFWAFIAGLTIGIVLSIIGYALLDDDEKTIPLESNFPKGAKDIIKISEDYYEFTYKKRRVLVYKPGTSSMSMTNLETYVR